jgi:hypothetical protein
MDNYWTIGIAVFLCILSFIKYSDTKQLKEWIDEFVCKISQLFDKIVPKEPKIEVVEDINDIIYDFVIRNKEKFSKVKVKDGHSDEEGTTEES